jgi:hypothetical protein
MLRSLKLPKRPKFLNLDFLPESFDQWVWPLALISAGLHTVLLFAPIPSTTPIAEKKPAELKPKTVKITSLPPIQSKSSVKNKLTSKNILKSRLSPRVQKGLVIRDPSKKVISKAASAPDRTPPKDRPVPPVTPAQIDEPSSDSSHPMNDFPHYPGALSGCLGIQSCYETGKSMDAIAQHFQKQLPLKKYTLTLTINDSDRKVFQISKSGAQQFLNILSEGTEGKTSLYVLAEKTLTLAELQQAVQIPSDFSENILAQLPAGADGESTDVLPGIFASPNDFFSKLGGTDADLSEINPEENSEIDSMKLVPGQTPQQLLSDFFMPNLTQAGYQQPKLVATYGGGQLYELKKGTFKPFYLNLVPAMGNKGTIVVVWRSKPS